MTILQLLNNVQQPLNMYVAGLNECVVSSSYKHIQDDYLWDLAKTNRVESIVAHNLLDALGEEKIPARWLKAHDEIHSRISSYLSELDYIASRLQNEGINLIALKNAGIARGIYPCPGCCPMGDIDVLVEKRHFHRAHTVLLSEGYNFEFRYPQGDTDLKVAEEGGGSEYWKILPSGEKLWFELQWRPVAGRWLTPEREPSAEELMDRSIPIEGTAVRLLAPEDNLLQVALHTAKHSYVRAPGFRLHTDVDRIVRGQTIDWDVFVARTLALKVKTAVYFSLAIPKIIFGTPIPEQVLARLEPPRWKETVLGHWIRKVGLYNPDQKKFSNIGYIIFTSLLYDDFGGLWRSVFPEVKWIQQRYGTVSLWLLPVYYTRRLAALLLKRNL